MSWSDNSDGSSKKNYKDTLNLLRTDFSIRASSAQKEPLQLSAWDNQDLYKAAAAKNKDRGPRFVLHDGPPYANGNLHMGHALNKVLKDIVTKQKRMSGCHVDFQPGWDCHGLPIELRVEAEGASKELDPVQFKKICRDYAGSWIDEQKKQFKALGVIADWDNHYATMSPAYEANILRCLADFTKNGYIERKGKTVPWCASCKTVLATAEIEHKDRKDPSIYVRFDIDPDQELPAGLKGKRSALLVWTTTPWTLPLNQFIAVHPDASYTILHDTSNDVHYLVGTDRVEAIHSKLPSFVVGGTLHSKEFVGLTLHHPLVKDRPTPVIADDLVSLNDGTACLHVAPGCGPEDYFIAVRHGVDVYSPLTPDGRYTDQITVPELAGMTVADGQWEVLRLLKSAEALVHKENILHAYPHCWRCRNGLIFRATDQWFCDLDKKSLLEKTLAAADKINFIPEWGKRRLTASIGSRTEWCISRQRRWGVPIAALICKGCSEGYITEKLLRVLADQVERDGIEFWDAVSFEELISLKAIPKDLACSKCGSSDFRKENDILDVWFDSGVSSHAVLKSNDQAVRSQSAYPADLYLEGSDQHRGWFQSSLLSSVALSNTSCMKAILTHGYVVDGKKHKMSKSLGNGIAPQEVVDRFGTDVLRLWVAFADFEGDVVISDDVLKNVAEAYRKIRNTLRFLLGNLHDFDIKNDILGYNKLRATDRYILWKLYELNREVRLAYDEFRFAQLSHLLTNFCINDLSSLYFDVVKDRLYLEAAAGEERRAVQTTLYAILDVLTHLLAPILSFTTEEVASCYRSQESGSIHLSDFPRLPDQWSSLSPEEANGWPLLISARREVMRSIERLREQGVVKLGLEASLTIHVDKSDSAGESFISSLKRLSELTEQSEEEILEQWFIVSSVQIVTDKSPDLVSTSMDWLSICTEHAPGVKCPRCWKWSESDKEDGLCDRCNSFNIG